MAKWMDIVKGVAPTLGSLLPGPLGPMVHKLIADAIGLPDAKPQTLEDKVASLTPDDLVKIKATEQAFTQAMGAQGVDLEKIAAGDRSDARAMQVATRSRTAPLLAAASIVILASMIVILAAVRIPPENREPFTLLLGNVIGIVGLPMSFYFGSSHGSQVKDATVASLANGGGK